MFLRPAGDHVECLVETRPATLCRSDISVEAFTTPTELSAALLAKHAQCDALLAIVYLDQTLWRLYIDILAKH